MPTQAILMGTDNQEVTDDELAKIRRLADFDLIMLISEIHDHGWPHYGRQVLHSIPDSILLEKTNEA